LIARLGVFGGTFDPLHVGHLVLAEQAREQLQLDEVLFVPAAAPPHKLGREMSAPRMRQEMVELAVAGHPQFAVSDLELRRTGPSYTIDTLRALRELYPQASLHLLLGGDSLVDFPTWRDPDRILELARLAVMQRESATPESPPSPQDHMLADRLDRILAPTISVSSSDLRRRVREGRSIRFLVPAAIDVYIRVNNLYAKEQPE